MYPFTSSSTTQYGGAMMVPNMYGTCGAGAAMSCHCHKPTPQNTCVQLNKCQEQCSYCPPCEPLHCCNAPTLTCGACANMGKGFKLIKTAYGSQR